MVLRLEGVRRPAWGAVLWGAWGGRAPGNGVVGFTPGLEVILAAWGELRGVDMESELSTVDQHVG